MYFILFLIIAFNGLLEQLGHFRRSPTAQINTIIQLSNSLFKLKLLTSHTELYQLC